MSLKMDEDIKRWTAKRKSTMQLAQFTEGDCVSFTDNGGAVKTGTILRLNKKTVSLRTDDDHLWKVATGFLRKAGK